MAGTPRFIFKSAENLLRGNGLGLVGPQGEFRLLPYFPPLFSLVISAMGLVGIDLVAGAHWLNMILFGALIWLAGIMMVRISKSLLFSLLLMFLLLASPVLIPIYSWAMSEPLSFFLGFGAISLIYIALDQDRKGFAFYVSALAAGLAFLTRYSAVAYIAAGALGWFFLKKGDLKKRIFDILVYGIVACIPMLIWLVYDISQTTTVASRSIETVSEMAWRFSNLWPSLEEVILFWVIPDSWVFFPEYDKIYNHILFFLLALIVIGWFILVVKNLFRYLTEKFYLDHYRFGFILLIFCLAYLAVIAVVYITTFPPITIYHRMISPVHIAVLWLVILMMSLSVKFWPNKNRLINILTIGFLFLVFWYGWRTTRIVQQNYEVGFGYTAPEWRNSETIEAVKELSKHTLIITNEQNAVLFLTDRPAYPMKEIYRVEPLSVFFSYGQGGGRIR